MGVCATRGSLGWGWGRVQSIESGRSIDGGYGRSEPRSRVIVGVPLKGPAADTLLAESGAGWLLVRARPCGMPRFASIAAQ